MRVAMLYADRGGCGFYRCFLPGQRAKQLGVDVAYASSLRAKVDGGSVVGVPPVIVDVLVYQRPMLRSLVDTIPFVKAQGVKVVVEVDDDLHSVHAQNAAYKAVHPKFNADQNYEHLTRAISMADGMTVSTEALADSYRGLCDDVRVIPNYVPDSLLDVTPYTMEPVDEGDVVVPAVRIGWAGQLAAHPTDLQVTRGAIGQAIAATGATFRVIGDPDGVPQALGLGSGAAFEATGWVPMEQYPGCVAGIDVGVVPLADSKFNRAKSWLKGLEMAALGVPFVASPTPEYEKLADLGVGMLASTPREWRRNVTALVQDADLRKELGVRGKKVVADDLTIGTNGHRWVSAWSGFANQLTVVRGLHAAAAKA